jgi:hypothetical protein
MVEAGVRTVMDVLIALGGGLLGLAGGYVFGVLRTLSESRNERRDNAIADIYKELSLFHRYLASWTGDYDPDPKEPTAASEGVPAREHVKGQYEKFVHTFHDVNAIWVGKDTYDLIQGFSAASRDLLNDLTDMTKRGGVWLLPDGTNPNDRRKERITPQYYQIRDALRAEVEASRYIIPYRIVIRKNEAGQRRTDPGEGE